MIDSPDAEIDRLLRGSGRIAATFVTTDRGVPATAWWVRDPGYGPESTQRQFRQNLRRAEGRVSVRPMSWEEFRALGLSVHRDVLTARGDRGALTLTPSGWESLCEAAEATAGMEATGCFVDATLAGYIVSWTSAGSCEGLLADIAPRFADMRPAHHLYHGFAAEMIRRPGVHGVTVGRTSIPARSSLDAFKRQSFIPASGGGSPRRSFEERCAPPIGSSGADCRRSAMWPCSMPRRPRRRIEP